MVPFVCGGRTVLRTGEGTARQNASTPGLAWQWRDGAAMPAARCKAFATASLWSEVWVIR